MNKAKKILIVEDEADICLAVQSYFGRRGFQVSSTGSGLEALSMISASRPDIVLLDLALNELNGLDAFKELRKTDQQTKVIIITGSTLPPAELETVKKLGLSGYRQKPLVLEELAGLVFQALGEENAAEKGPAFNALAENNVAATEISQAESLHQVKNLLGIIRNKCENYTLNLSDGIYDDKKPDELVKIAVQIMKDVEQTVDRIVKVLANVRSK